MHERAILAGRQLKTVDADRNNAILASFVKTAVRPDDATPEAMFKLLEEQTQLLIEEGGTCLFDIGGGDRLFAEVAEFHNFFIELPAAGIEIVLYYFLAGGRDDIETLLWMEAAGLRVEKTVVILNEGLAPKLSGDADPFAVPLATDVVGNIRKRGGKILRMPVMRLATMAAADALYLPFTDVAAGKVPVDDNGVALQGATPLGFWQQREVSRWLRQLEENIAEAGIGSWLP